MSDHNQEAESAAPCHNCRTITTCMEMGCGQGSAARRAPAVGEDGLPPLPEKIGTLYRGNYWTGLPHANPPGAPLADVYTTEQYRQGQREAVAADRRARPQQIADVILHLIGECTMDWKPSDDDEPFSSDDAERGHIVRLVNQALAMRAQQPASAAQDVKKWQERMAEYYSADGSKLAHGTSHFKDQEIADLRAQLAATTENLQTAVREAWETHAELSKLRAQLALKTENLQTAVSARHEVATECQKPNSSGHQVVASASGLHWLQDFEIVGYASSTQIESSQKLTDEGPGYRMMIVRRHPRTTYVVPIYAPSNHNAQLALKSQEGACG